MGTYLSGRTFRSGSYRWALEAVVAKEREKAVELSARLQKNSESINRMRALQ